MPIPPLLAAQPAMPMSHSSCVNGVRLRWLMMREDATKTPVRSSLTSCPAFPGIAKNRTMADACQERILRRNKAVRPFSSRQLFRIPSCSVGSKMLRRDKQLTGIGLLRSAMLSVLCSMPYELLWTTQGAHRSGASRRIVEESRRLNVSCVHEASRNSRTWWICPSSSNIGAWPTPGISTSSAWGPRRVISCAVSRVSTSDVSPRSTRVGQRIAS